MKISIDNSLKDGFKRMKYILFQPFDFVKWLIIGFASFLASLGRGGGGGPRFNLPTESFGRNGNAGDLSTLESWVSANLIAIILIALGAIAVGFAIFLILTWLSSRGQFLFIYAIAENKAEIKEPWVKYGHLGDRLFVFRLVLGVIVFTIVLMLLALGIFMLYPHIKGASFGLSAFLKMAILALFIILFMLFIGLIKLILMDFVVPLMFKKDVKVLEGFSIFYNELFRGNISSFFFFYLVKIGLSIAAGFVVLLATCLTCCVAALPYISSVVFLPIAAFFESFTLSFLGEFGKEYNLYTWSPEENKSQPEEKIEDHEIKEHSPDEGKDKEE